MFKLKKILITFSCLLCIYSPLAESASKKSKEVIEFNHENWPQGFYELMDHGWNKFGKEGLLSYYPRMNIEETDNSYRVEAEMPGVKKEEIDIKLKDDSLVISFERKVINEESKKRYHRLERAYGSFYRVVSIPRDIDKNKIKAELSDGILKIEIGKAKSSPPSVEQKIIIR